MNPVLFSFFESCAPYLVLWSLVFTAITSVRIVRRIRLGVDRVPDNAVYTELAGLPLALLQTVCFVYAVWIGDWISMLLFLWWGPGFVLGALTVVIAKARRKPIDWYARASSPV